MHEIRALFFSLLILHVHRALYESRGMCGSHITVVSAVNGSHVLRLPPHAVIKDDFKKVHKV